jgi:hypothetical protein
MRVTPQLYRVFGKREVELAAIAIVEKDLLERAFTRAEVLAGRPDVGGYEDAGLTLALEAKWLVPVGSGRVRCSREFVDRVKAALEREQQEAAAR